MATEEELRDAQILKTSAETELSKEQLRDLQRSSEKHIIRRVSQGVGVGLVLALAGMALFGPIKDVIEANSQAAAAKSEVASAESKLAAINARIAETNNAELQQQLDQRQQQLKKQEARFTDDLKRLAEDLRRANTARDAAIDRYKDLEAREKELAEKYDQLASQRQDNEELAAKAKAAQDRAVKLESEVAQLRVEAQAAEEATAKVDERLSVRSLKDYAISVAGDPVRSSNVAERLGELGLGDTPGRPADCSRNTISYAEGVPLSATQLLKEALDTVLPDAEILPQQWPTVENLPPISSDHRDFEICAQNMPASRR